jgi:hypothetical protein
MTKFPAASLLSRHVQGELERLLALPDPRRILDEALSVDQHVARRDLGKAPWGCRCNRLTMPLHARPTRTSPADCIRGFA